MKWSFPNLMEGVFPWVLILMGAYMAISEGQIPDGGSVLGGHLAGLSLFFLGAWMLVVFEIGHLRRRIAELEKVKS